ncbi:hypothetical protein SFUMM280S_02385 [Streptomyces fumanus]
MKVSEDAEARCPYRLVLQHITSRWGVLVLIELLDRPELARKEHVQPPSMTRIVALLEAKGLVRLEPHPEDRRQKVVTQTEQAVVMLRRAAASGTRSWPRWWRGSTRTSGRRSAPPPPYWRNSHTCKQRTEEATFLSTGPGAASAPAPDHHDTLSGPRRGTSMFASLKVRNYRLFFMGQVVSNIGTWMQRIAQDWLVLSLTGSSAAVGITTALQFLPMLLFGLYGGVLVDRLRKRPTLLVTQSAMALTAIFLAVLTLTGPVDVWHVYLAAFAMGPATVMDNPARQSFVSELVGPDQLQNAVSLNLGQLPVRPAGRPPSPA